MAPVERTLDGWRRCAFMGRFFTPLLEKVSKRTKRAQIEVHGGFVPAMLRQGYRLPGSIPTAYVEWLPQYWVWTGPTTGSSPTHIGYPESALLGLAYHYWDSGQVKQGQVMIANINEVRLDPEWHDTSGFIDHFVLKFAPFKRFSYDNELGFFSVSTLYGSEKVEVKKPPTVGRGLRIEEAEAILVPEKLRHKWEWG